MNELLKNAELTAGIFEGMTDEEKSSAAAAGEMAASIQMRRKALGLSKQDLAKRIGVTEDVLTMWEDGDEDIGGNDLDKLSDVLNINLNSALQKCAKAV